MGLFDGTPLEQPVTCEVCGKPLKGCGCARDAEGKLVNPKAFRVRVRREKRRGNWTAVVEGLEDAERRGVDLKALLKQLKSGLGAGGGVSGGELVIQGDHRDAVVQKLRSLGYDAKSGGG